MSKWRRCVYFRSGIGFNCNWKITKQSAKTCIEMNLTDFCHFLAASEFTHAIDTDCPGGMGCFGNTECYYSDDLVPTQTPVRVTEAPVTGAPIAYGDAANTRFCGVSWGMASVRICRQCSYTKKCNILILLTFFLICEIGRMLH